MTVDVSYTGLRFERKEPIALQYSPGVTPQLVLEHIAAQKEIIWQLGQKLEQAGAELKNYRRTLGVVVQARADMEAVIEQEIAALREEAI